MFTEIKRKIRDAEDLLSRLTEEERIEAERQMCLFGNVYIEVITDEDKTTCRLIKTEDMQIISSSGVKVRG